MTTKEMIFKKIDETPEDFYNKIYEFLESLKTKKNAPKKKTKDIEGLWKGHGPEITAEDIDEARKEMWGNFPRDDF